LKIFDASGEWPTDPAACWADGYRVIAGYAGSQSWKTFTPAMLAKWVTPAHPFGIAAMYEGTGREPLEAGSAAAGTQHARAARAAWRAIGMPDTAAIAYAVDTDVNMAQVKGSIAAYFRAVAAADTTRPISYLENDGSEWLAMQGITAGGFIPAAYSWGDPPVLATPSNAPPHALWLQEHNGVPLHGGDVDTGHIRHDAPIWWADGGTTMAGFDKTDLNTLLKTAAFPYASPPGATPVVVPSVSLGTTWLATRNNTDKLIASQAAQDKQLAALLAAVTALAAGGTSVDTAAVLAAIHDEGAKESAAVAGLHTQIADLRAALAAAQAAGAAAIEAAP
jgi:hypothetical protein